MKARPVAFVDTETTGLDPTRAEVIEVAIIRVEPNGQEVVYHTLIRPENIEDAHPKAWEVNGYAADPSRWDTAPTMGAVGHTILGMLQGCLICGHNEAFDEVMLNANLKRAGITKRVPYHKVDTITLAFEHLVPLGLTRLSLDTIRDFLGWSKEGAHTALQDAKDARALYALTCRMGWWGRLKLRWRLRMRRR